MNQTITTEGSTSTVLAFYAAVAEGALEPARRLLDPDVELHVPGTHPLAGVHVGPDAVLGFVAGSRDRTDHGEDIEVLDVLAGTDHVGVLCTVRATRTGRAPLENRTIHLLRMEAGRIAEIWLHNFDDLTVNDFWS